MNLEIFYPLYLFDLHYDDGDTIEIGMTIENEIQLLATIETFKRMDNKYVLINSTVKIQL